MVEKFKEVGYQHDSDKLRNVIPRRRSWPTIGFSSDVKPAGITAAVIPLVSSRINRYCRTNVGTKKGFAHLHNFIANLFRRRILGVAFSLPFFVGNIGWPIIKIEKHS